MYDTSFIKRFVSSISDHNNALDPKDISVLVCMVQQPDTDLRSLEQLCGLLFGYGHVQVLETPVERLIWDYKQSGRPVPELLSRIQGYVDFMKTGVLIPSRRASRFRPHMHKVLSFYHAVPPFHTTGYAMRTHALAKAARDHGKWTYRHHSRIGYPWDVRGHHKNPESRRTWYEDVVYLHEQGHASARGNLKKYVADASASIRRAIYLERPAVVHAASAYVNALPALMAARSMGVPFVYEVRGLWELTAAMGREGWEQTDRFRVEKDIETILATEADGVIAITEGVRSELIERGVDPSRIVLSPNSISVNSLSQLPPDAQLQTTLELDPSVPTLGYIGSFVEYEGLEQLLEAVQLLKSEGLRFNVLLVGDGPHYQSFLKTVSQMGLQDEIFLPGRIPHSQVARYYSVIDIAVFPRLPYRVCQLVSPLKPLEALLLGKLVVGSSVGGIREIISHEENGLIYEAGDLQALTGMLRDVVTNLDNFSELRRKGQSWVVENRRWSSNIEASETLFERVALKARPTGHSLPVEQRQSLSIQSDANVLDRGIALNYRTQDGSRLSQRVQTDARPNDKHIFADVITPAGAVELLTVTDWGGFAVNAAPVENYYRIGINGRYRIQETLPLTSLDLESDKIDVTPGGSYYLRVHVVVPAEIRDHAVIGIRFFGVETLDVAQIGLQRLAHSPDCVYSYVPMAKGTLTLPFRVPDDVYELSIFARKWSAKPKEAVSLLSGIELEPRDSPGDPILNRFRSAEAIANKSLGESAFLLSKTPARAHVPVRPGRRYEMTVNIAVMPGIELSESRGGVVTYKFTNSATGEKIRSTKLKFSDPLGANFNYFSGSGKLVETIIVPEGADRMDVGLQCWNAVPGDLKCADRLLLEEQGRHEYLLEWNGDRKVTNILLFADLNINMVDGSTVWLVSMANALAMLENSMVHVLLRYPATDSAFADELNRIPNCRILEPISHFNGKAYFTSEEMPDIIRQIDQDFGGFDHLVIRGFNVNYSLTNDARLDGRLCPYLTDIPQQDSDLTPEIWGQIELIFRRAGTIFIQSSWLIDFVKEHWPDHERKFSQLPPMLPEINSEPTKRAGGFTVRNALDDVAQDRQRIVYAGKMAPEWGILELFDAFDEMRADNSELELHILGSKIHDPKDAPDFYPAVRERLMAGNGLVWRRDLDRQSVLRLLPQFAVGWSWRAPAFENSNLEFSTKLLEYGKCGLPVVLTKTDRYQELLGRDYPFLASSEGAAKRALSQALTDKKASKKAVSQLQKVLAPHGIGEIARRSLAPALGKSLDSGSVVLLAGHDLKFSGDLQAELLAQGHQVLVDRWQSRTGHDENHSQRLLERADRVICEWALRNLVWYSHNIRPEQKLIARLHAQELFTHHLNHVNWAAVHKLVFVSEQCRQIGIKNFAIPPEKCVVVPNSVNTNWHQLGPGSTGKHIGFMGIVPWLKRPDRAIEIVRRVLHEDPEFTFSIKGKVPEDYPWMKNRPEESEQYFELFRDIVHDPLLQGAVSFEGFGHDVPIWSAGLDFILSTSDRESFHMSVAECAAAGVNPVILPWDGAADLYPSKWVVADEAAAADRILKISRLPTHVQKDLRKKNADIIAKTYGADKISRRITDLLFH